MIGKNILYDHITEKLGEGGMGVAYKADFTLLKGEGATSFGSYFLLKSKKSSTPFPSDSKLLEGFVRAAARALPVTGYRTHARRSVEKHDTRQELPKAHEK